MKAKLNKPVICADGFSMSVQANETAYCRPRIDNAERYEAVEVGFPTEEEALLLDYADDRENPTDTVYGWVPSETVTLVIAKHRGMVEGEVPPGIIPLRSIDESR
jgi:hypothetical protein